MKRPNVSVVVASEHPAVRYFLKEMVEPEGGITVSQAQDVFKTLVMVRNLKPDVAIIDCYLPYAVNLHNLPLSRMGGLDLAQTITQEAPNTKVVLLNNLDSVMSTDRAVIAEDGRTYSMKSIENDMPLTIRNLQPAATRPNNLVFADVEAAPQEELGEEQARDNPFDVAIFFGALGIVLGWLLIVSMLSATIGAAIALAGIAIVLLGIAAKLTTPLWRRLFRRKPRE